MMTTNEYEVSERRSIVLPQGGMLDVELTPAFLAKVKKQFGIPEDVSVNDDYVRMFIYGALKNAVEKAEAEND